VPRLNRPHKGWLRSRPYRETRRLLDQAYQEYFETSRNQSHPRIASTSSPLPTSLALPINQDALEAISYPSPLPLPRFPSSAFSDALTERIFPNIPPPTPDFSLHHLDHCHRLTRSRAYSFWKSFPLLHCETNSLFVQMIFLSP